MFSNASKDLASALLPGSSLDLDIKVGERSAKARALVKRTFRDAARVYYGLEYEEMAPEDFRFLFEYLYGRPFVDDDLDSVEGVRTSSP